MFKHAVGFASLAVLALFNVGCCGPAPRNVTVTLDDAMRKHLVDDLSSRHIQVDIVALNSEQAKRWKDASMTTYWTYPYELHNSVQVYTMDFDPAKPGEQTLWANDKHWKDWGVGSSKDEMQLFVLALLPGTVQDQPGENDPRRQILPLDKCRWEGGQAIKLKVQSSGIITMTPPKKED